LADTPDLLTFIKRLEEAEVGWTANIASTGKMNGFSFEYRDIAFKASQLERLLLGKSSVSSLTTTQTT
jgi:hypothetical protein